jgi:hypothetical protein
VLFGIAKPLDAFGLYISVIAFAVAGGISALLCLMMNAELRKLPPIILRGLAGQIKRASASPSA